MVVAMVVAAAVVVGVPERDNYPSEMPYYMVVVKIVVASIVLPQ